MEIALLIITLVGFTGLFVYQHYKIRTLKDQTTMQGELLASTKTYFEIVNPEMIKYRLEHYETLIGKEKSLEIKKVQRNFFQQLETKVKESPDKHLFILDIIREYTSAFSEALYYIPSNIRKRMIEKMKQDDLKKFYQRRLHEYEELERSWREYALNLVRSNGREGTSETVGKGKISYRKIIAKSENVKPEQKS
jgi:hypothetical protein